MAADRLLDAISRTLASPIPRRSAVKMIAGGIGAAAAAFFSGREARAECKKNEKACGQNCCPPGHECVANMTVCCPPGQVCGPDLCCPTGQECITEGNNRKRCLPHKPSKSDR